MIVKAKVKLQKENPFFAYLVMNLKFEEVEECPSIGVDGLGNCIYNAKFIESLTEGELKSVLSHEVLHIVLEHLLRLDSRDQELFNISTDLVINHLLVNNNFEFGTELTKYSLIPYRDSYTFQGLGIEVKDIGTKSAEMVYDELYLNPKIKKLMEQRDQEGNEEGDGNGKGKFKIKRFDKHKYSKEDKRSKSYIENKKKWNDAFSEASVYAKQQGKLPAGMERLIGSILDEKVNWKNLLYKYITRSLPYDYTYNRPSKKSVSSGFYMPSILRENIDITISVDTSGSIGKNELDEFLGEIIGIAKSFSNIDMKLIVCDCEIKDVYRVANGDIAKIQNLTIRGGGGTSHLPVYDYVRENLPQTKFLINFTDGYTDFPKHEEVRTIWVLTKNSCKDENIPFGDIIRME
jgi:predicted metal-dependent peptidase